MSRALRLHVCTSRAGHGGVLGMRRPCAGPVLCRGGRGGRQLTALARPAAAWLQTYAVPHRPARPTGGCSGP